jgi:DNA repair protein RecN (Recombination protein N)
MIASLSIRNYALIKNLEMQPSPRLNIITGETGAGKSIMLGAVGLLLGNRADTKVLLNEGEKCVVEATFRLKDYNLKPVFSELDLDYEEESIIRREISPGGKSRAFVNDTPVNLDALRQIGEHLMDIHSQHENLQLGENSYQLRVIDAYAGNTELLEKYQASYAAYVNAKKTLDRLIAKSKESLEDQDYKQFLFNELEEANLQEGEQEHLEQELEKLEHAEEIKLKLNQAIHLLDGAEQSALAQLREVRQMIGSLANFSTALDENHQRIESLVYELDDVLKELTREEAQTEHDPERIEAAKGKLDVLFRLQQKHKVNSVADLIRIKDELDGYLGGIENLDEAIKQAEKDFEAAKSKLGTEAAKLTHSRKKITAAFSKEVEQVIRQLGIPNGTVETRISEIAPTPTGTDLIDILFSANKGIAPQEIKHVASGGEFSRLIFAIKYLIADKTALPTIIFDEIDTGVSGEVAIKMVKMMQKMAENHQVVSISHLPQFAAGGHAHYYVYKDHTEARSVSKIRKLENEDRIVEIAKMIGGDQPTEAAYNSAKELVEGLV